MKIALAKTRSPDILVPLNAPRDVTVDLVVFPCAGAGPSEFLGWRDALPEGWRLASVCLQGRGSRLDESLPSDLEATADEIATAIREALPGDRRVLLLGHSMGAILAFEVATRTAPLGLAVCACPPVHMLHHNPTADIDWNAEIRKLAAGHDIPDALLGQLCEIAMPVLSADLAMVDGYRWNGKTAACDIWSFYGKNDYILGNSWAPQTRGKCDVIVVPGDHYFVRDFPGIVIRELASRLEVA